jgi:hypothetical protein
VWRIVLFFVCGFAFGEPAFDYFGTAGGEAQIKGKCSTASKDELRCEFTEVRPFPLEKQSGERHELEAGYPEYRKAKEEELRAKKSPPTVLPAHGIPDNELRPFWKIWFTKQLAEDSEKFERMRAEECKNDPRDFYQSRAAFHETYDEFLGRAKVIQQKLCEAKEPGAFASAWSERWALMHLTCELDYAHYTLVLKKKGNQIWTAKGETQGPQRFARCYGSMKTELDCSVSENCRLVRGYDLLKEDSLPSTLKKYRSFLFLRRGLDDCSTYPKTLEQTFAKEHRRNTPKSCQYFIDRERSSQCCAYGK